MGKEACWKPLRDMILNRNEEIRGMRWLKCRGVLTLQALPATRSASSP